MADTGNRTNWDAFLFELEGTVHEAYAAEAVYMSELQGVGDSERNRVTRAMDHNGEIFSGSQVRHTVDLTTMGSGGWPGETGTWNAPSATNAQKVYDKLCEFVQAFSVTVSVERDSVSRSNASAVARLTMKAGQATAINQNIAALGEGTGLLATITDAATSLTTTVTGANWDILLPGTIWDVLTRSSGADPGQGLRRSIASVSKTSSTAGTITWNTAATASDGGSGSIVHASTSGVYIPGSYSTVGTTDYIPNGIQEAALTTGTFQGLSRTTYPQWAGTDGRDGTTTTAALSEQMLMAGARLARPKGANNFDFGIFDPACIDLYIQGFFAQRMFNPDIGTLKSGWSGPIFGGAGSGLKPFPLIGDMHCPKTKGYLVDKKEITVYGDDQGPSFLADDGAKFRRFSRTLTKEAELVDRMNILYTNCSHIVSFANLDVAS